MMEQTKIYAALHGVRGRKAIDLARLEQILVRFSEMVVEQPWIKECDINPLLVSPETMIALDARVILHDPRLKEEELPRPAIRPYPFQYLENWSLKDGTQIMLRPIRPEDEPFMHQFHKDLSQETVRQRYLKVVHYEERVAHARLQRICFNDYDREIALVALHNQEILGVMRLAKMGAGEAIFTLTIKDKWQNKGIGAKFMEKVLLIAAQEKIHTLRAQMLKENFQMEKLCKHFGFNLIPKDKYVLAEKKI